MKLENIILKSYVFLVYGRFLKNKNVKVYGFFAIKNKDFLHISGELSINDFVYVNARGGVYLGDNVSLSAGCKIISTGLTIDERGPSKKHFDKKIVIGDNVQIGAGAVVLAGVKICSNVVVGASSVVTRDIQTPGVYVGSPAKLVRKFG